MRKKNYINGLLGAICFVACGEDNNQNSGKDASFRKRENETQAYDNNNQDPVISGEGDKNLNNRSSSNSPTPPLKPIPNNKNSQNNTRIIIDKSLQNNKPGKSKVNSQSCLVINGIHHPGLRNKGNTCYLNSVIQQLYCLKPFREVVLKSNPNNGTPILETVKDFFEGMSNSQNSYFDPDELPSKLGYCGDQEDAGFFFQCVYNLFDSESKGSIFGPFLFKMNSTIKCEKCSKKSTSEELIGLLPCTYLTSYGTLQESLNVYFTEKEILDEIKETSSDGNEKVVQDNRYECGNCNAKTRASQEFKIKSLPQIFVFSLSRFEYDTKSKKFNKLNKRFEFPEDLVIEKKWMKDGTLPEDQRSYKLSGVVVHSGSVDGGHYWSYTKLEDGNWYKFNDSIVSKVDINEDSVKRDFYGDGTSGTSGYILFYTKNN